MSSKLLLSIINGLFCLHNNSAFYAEDLQDTVEDNLQKMTCCDFGTAVL